MICPKCHRQLSVDEPVCPIAHDITGGVHAVTLGALNRTPQSKRHLLGVTIGDKYVINGFLGAGGFGAVYRAEQVALGRDVALKLIMVEDDVDPEVIGRFQREARTAAVQLDPNIIPLFDYGEATLGEGGQERLFYFAMELVHGPTLRQMLKAVNRKGPRGLGLDASLALGRNILQGLAAAHQLGVVHRDLKPGNVLIDESKGRKHFARLFDFGISSLQGSGGHTTHVGGTGGVTGTPKYMAPEQWRATQTAPCTDVYAFGVMLVEMLVGKPPVGKDELVKMASAHCRDPRPNVRKTALNEAMPKALTNFIKKCMAVDPRQRYGNAREALAALEAIDEVREDAPVPGVTHFPAPGQVIPGDPSGSLSGSAPGSLSGVYPPGMASLSGQMPAPLPVQKSNRWLWLAVSILLITLGWVLFRPMISSPSSPVLTAATIVHVDASPPVIDAAVPDAAIPDTAIPDAAPVIDAAVPDATVPDAAIPDAAIPDAAPSPPKPKPRPKLVKKVVRKKVAKVAPVTAAAPATAVKPVKVSGVDVTPKSNLTPKDRALAEQQYDKGLDAMRRGAPKSAQQFLVKALRMGLKGSKAQDAQRRIKKIVDRATLEASDF